MVAVVYSTRRGATEKIAREIARNMGEKVKAYNLSRALPGRLDNFVVVGSPIYYEKPLPEVTDFLRNENHLHNNRVAIFVVCIADAFGKLGRKYVEARYLGSLKKSIQGEIVDERIFRGWLLRENKKTLEEARLWGKKLSRFL